MKITIKEAIDVLSEALGHRSVEIKEGQTIRVYGYFAHMGSGVLDGEPDRLSVGLVKWTDGTFVQFRLRDRDGRFYSLYQCHVRQCEILEEPS